MVNITDKENRNVRNDYLPWYEKRHVTSSQKLKQSLPHIRNSRQTRRTFLPLQREHTHLGEWLLFISCMWWLLGNMGNLLLNTFFWYSYLYANIIAQVTWLPLSLHPILRCLFTPFSVISRIQQTGSILQLAKNCWFSYSKSLQKWYEYEIKILGIQFFSDIEEAIGICYKNKHYF